MSQRLQTDRFGTGATLRRALDIVIAATALTIAGPLLILIAIAIRLDSPGPLLYSQLRLGRGGRRFRLFKFRKFHDHASSARAVTLKNDSRMTKVGRWLERTKLDEFPQFWNVLVGEMAVVGPRPESVAFADCFEGPFKQVLDHTPGLFGPSQVVFRNESSMYPANEDPHDFYRAVLFPTKARIDLAYFRRRTLAGDLQWILRGAQVVLWSKALGQTAVLSLPDFEPRPSAPSPAVSIPAVQRERQLGLPLAEVGE
jgi:lipopolysaccharide/colanic/teichoic acid biosynthesis glycosyltransferase